ncbi:hypothetical protein PWP93_04830 [Paraburkholderia sp. A1RI-2L]|uniref:hypothetical protein n=1 Tax=Paraburkholderia sp. A1RI-2L TaxID=3028367 RepID=UPI003B7F4547
MPEWSIWRKFPNPKQHGELVAPFGPGCYELRHGDELLFVGIGKNVASRMSSILPAPLGSGTRNNDGKRTYVLDNLDEVEYRTLACLTREEAEAQERELMRTRRYRFPT